MTEETNKPTNKKYLVLVQLSYLDANGKGKIVKVGENASDIPAISVKWLLDQGCIKEI